MKPDFRIKMKLWHCNEKKNIDNNMKIKCGFYAVATDELHFDFLFVFSVVKCNMRLIMLFAILSKRCVIYPFRDHVVNRFSFKKLSSINCIPDHIKYLISHIKFSDNGFLWHCYQSVCVLTICMFYDSSSLKILQNPDLWSLSNWSQVSGYITPIPFTITMTITIPFHCAFYSFSI